MTVDPPTAPYQEPPGTHTPDMHDFWLLIFGIVVAVGFYLIGRSQRRRRTERPGG